MRLEFVKVWNFGICGHQYINGLLGGKQKQTKKLGDLILDQGGQWPLQF